MNRALSLALLFITFLMNTDAQTPAELVELWDREHVTRILPSNVRHNDLKKYLDGLRKLGVRVDEVGRSFLNREIYQVEWGKGPIKVFLWSQMHGDESTATMAIFDILNFFDSDEYKQEK